MALLCLCMVGGWWVGGWEEGRDWGPSGERRWQGKEGVTGKTQYFLRGRTKKVADLAHPHKAHNAAVVVGLLSPWGVGACVSMGQGKWWPKISPRPPSRPLASVTSPTIDQ